MPLFEFVMGGGPERTPEEKAEAAKKRLHHRQHHERQVKDALPLIQEVRTKLRELNRIGFNDERVISARREFATLADDLQSWLEAPIENPCAED